MPERVHRRGEINSVGRHVSCMQTGGRALFRVRRFVRSSRFVRSLRSSRTINTLVSHDPKSGGQ